MTFDITETIRDRLGWADDPETMADLDRPDDVTVERVREELERAIASGDFSLERSGFDDQSALLEAAEPIVRDYHDNYESLSLLNQFQTGWESDTHRSYADAVDEQVDDDIADLIERRGAEVVSVLKGFGSTGTNEWLRDYGGRYPVVGCLTVYVFARGELEERGYLE